MACMTMNVTEKLKSLCLYKNTWYFYNPLYQIIKINFINFQKSILMFCDFTTSTSHQILTYHLERSARTAQWYAAMFTELCVSSPEGLASECGEVPLEGPVKREAASPVAQLRVELCSRDLWRKFHALGTEMIITKAGRWVSLHKITPRDSPNVTLHSLCPSTHAWRNIYNETEACLLKHFQQTSKIKCNILIFLLEKIMRVTLTGLWYIMHPPVEIILDFLHHHCSKFHTRGFRKDFTKSILLNTCMGTRVISVLKWWFYVLFYYTPLID